MKVKFNWSILTSIWLPLTLLGVYLIMAYLLKDALPSSEEILHSFTKLFAKYGYEIIFVGAFLEAALIIDLFVPGTSVVLAGAYFSSIGVMSYPIFLIVAATGFFLGYLLDYLVGYLGFSDILAKFGLASQLNKIHNQVETMGGKAFFIGYFHPDAATLFAVAAGIVKMPLKEFALYNLLAGSLWLIFWTGLVYFFGSQFQQLFDNDLVWLLLLIPIIFIIISLVRKQK